MSKLKAFVGHSFNDDDAVVVRAFLDYFNTLDTILAWEHAEEAEPKELAAKVKERMKDKNLFIGIFTRRRREISVDKLKKSLFRPHVLKAIADDFDWSASDWVVQESGYALGIGMKTIFIVEEGISSVGGLQGDIEYIPFARDKVSTAFSKINQMLFSLVSVDKAITEKAEVVEHSTETKESSPVSPPEEEKAEVERDALKDLVLAIGEGNAEKEQEALDKYLESKGDGTETGKVQMLSLYYRIRYDLGKENVLEDLLGLSNKHPEHPSPHFNLGVLYEDYKLYDKAHSHFMKASELSDEKVNKLAYICRAAKTITKNGKAKEGKELLIEYLRNHSEDVIENYEIFKTLAGLQKEANNFERYFSLAEKAIHLKPTDNDLRFSLAFDYSKKNNHIMAFHHYRILCDSNSSAFSWNNLGVEFSELDMQGKSVDAYLKSKEEGGTTAVGNLAYKLIDAGYYNMAKDYLREALKDPDSSSNVSKALSKLEGLVENEKTTEEECLRNSSPEMEFRLKYSEAYAQGNNVQVKYGHWKSLHGDIEIINKGGMFEAKGEHEVVPFGLAAYARAASGLFVKPKQDVDIKTIKYTGSVVYGVIDYKLTVTTRKKGTEPPASILAISTDNVIINEYTGQMIIDENGKVIRAMERNEKGKVSYYTLEYIEGSPSTA